MRSRKIGSNWIRRDVSGKISILKISSRRCAWMFQVSAVLKRRRYSIENSGFVNTMLWFSGCLFYVRSLLEFSVVLYENIAVINFTFIRKMFFADSDIAFTKLRQKNVRQYCGYKSVSLIKPQSNVLHSRKFLNNKINWKIESIFQSEFKHGEHEKEPWRIYKSFQRNDKCFHSDRTACKNWWSSIHNGRKRFVLRNMNYRIWLVGRSSLLPRPTHYILQYVY